jgi:hypothetical protein
MILSWMEKITYRMIRVTQMNQKVMTQQMIGNENLLQIISKF